MPRKRVEIEVTPLSQQGDTVDCQIDPPSDHNKNGHVRLDKGQTYTLQFNLRPGNIPTLKFKPDVNGACDAFWSNPSSCPTISESASQYSNPSLNGAKRLDIDVDTETGGPPLEIHYRLNFDEDRSFDPIIIHD